MFTTWPNLQDAVSQHDGGDLRPLIQWLEDNTSQYDILCGLFTTIEESITTSERRTLQLRQQLDRATMEGQALQNEKDGLQQQVLTLQQTGQMIENERNTLQQQVRDLQQEGEIAQRERDTLSQRINTLTTSYRNLEQELARRRSQPDANLAQPPHTNPFQQNARDGGGPPPPNSLDTTHQNQPQAQQPSNEHLITNPHFHQFPPQIAINQNDDGLVPQRPRGPDVHIFRGDAKDGDKRQEEYTNWRSALRLKLALDKATYPSASDRIMYAAQRLEGDAFSRIRSKVDEVAANPTSPWQWTHGWQDVNDLIKHLDEVYITIDELATAYRNFKGLKQGNMAFGNFLAAFNRHADQCDLAPELRVNAMKEKINSRLKDQLVGIVNRPGPHDITGWIHTIRQLANNIADKTFYTNQYNGNNQSRDHQKLVPAPPQGDPMDLGAARTGVGPKGPLSQEEKDRRRRLGLCLYCGEPGHMSMACEKRAAAARYRAAAATQTPRTGEPSKTEKD